MSDTLTEKGQRILETISKAVQQLSEPDKEKLLAFSEGVALMAERQQDVHSTKAQ